MQKKLLNIIILILTITFSLIAFSATKNNTIYTEDEPNVVVDAKHPEFTIKLKSNPTTGYTWFLREYDMNFIIPIKHYFQKPEKKEALGAPGFEFWTFRVKPAGFIVPQQTLIRFNYARPWERADNPTQTAFLVTMR